MKRYEKMSKEEIISAYDSVGDCGECHARNFCKDITEKLTCRENVTGWLMKEIKMTKVHRYETIKSDEDLDNIRAEFVTVCAGRDMCDCCIFYDDRDMVAVALKCFANYLKEEIEVEEE